MISVLIISSLNMERKPNYCLQILIAYVCYEIETKDGYKDFWVNKNMFDNSEYPKDSPYNDSKNKKVIGKF